MVEGKKVISNDQNLAQLFNEHFGDIVPHLDNPSFYENNYDVSNDNIDNTFTKFEAHLNIVAIKKQMKLSPSRKVVQTRPL